MNGDLEHFSKGFMVVLHSTDSSIHSSDSSVSLGCLCIHGLYKPRNLAGRTAPGFPTMAIGYPQRLDSSGSIGFRSVVTWLQMEKELNY